MIDLIVSQHDGLAEWAEMRGLAPRGTAFRTLAHTDEVMAKTVMTTGIPLHLASAANEVHEITLHLREDQRGRTLSWTELDEAYRGVQIYRVHRRAFEIADMGRESPHMPPVKVVVTRHAGLVEYLQQLGIAEPDALVIPHAQAEDVRGRAVAGVLPLWLASEAACVIAVDMQIPPHLRGTELSVTQMKLYAVSISVYVVARVDGSGFTH